MIIVLLYQSIDRFGQYNLKSEKYITCIKCVEPVDILKIENYYLIILEMALRSFVTFTKKSYKPP